MGILDVKPDSSQTRALRVVAAGRLHRGGMRLDTEINGEDGLKLVDRIRLGEERGVLDKKCLHSVRDGVAGGVEHPQAALFLYRRLRQSEPGLGVTAKFDVGE
jgi:hypothetical protein